MGITKGDKEMKLFIDIETIPSQREGEKDRIKENISPPGTMKKAETIQKWWDNDSGDAVDNEYRKTSFNGGLGEIVSISWALDESEIYNVHRGLGGDESDMIISFFETLERQLGSSSISLWVGHYICGFDMRFMFHRCVVLGISPSVRIPYNDKPWSGKVFDTMHEWAGSGSVSLDNLCYYLGLEGKSSDIDGSKVWDYIKAGREKEVAIYNDSDVDKVRKIHHAMTSI
jgi:predicted PolB exonuclease-like 3'-5' exonuclease